MKLLETIMNHSAELKFDPGYNPAKPTVTISESLWSEIMEIAMRETRAPKLMHVAMIIVGIMLIVFEVQIMAINVALRTLS